MRRIRIQKRKSKGMRVLEEVPSLDPRDPDVVRAKRLMHAARSAPRSRAA